MYGIYMVLSNLSEKHKSISMQRDILKYDVIFLMKKKPLPFSQCQLKPNLALKLHDLYHFFRLVEKDLLTSFVSRTVECYFR